MELKKVSSISEKKYAKIDEVSKKQLKSSMPNKWIISGILGSAVATYTTSNKLFSIGVVFGCATIMQDGDIILTDLGETVAAITITLGIILLVNGIIFLVRSLYYKKWKEQLENENEEKMKKSLKKQGYFLITIIILLSSLCIYSVINKDKLETVYHSEPTNSYQMKSGV